MLDYSQVSHYYQQLALSQAGQDKGPTGGAAPFYAGPDAFSYLQAQVGPVGPRGPPGEWGAFLHWIEIAF